MDGIRPEVTRGVRKVYPPGGRRIKGELQEPIGTEPGKFRWHAYLGDKNVANGPVAGFETEEEAMAAYNVFAVSEGARIQDPTPGCKLVKSDDLAKIWLGGPLSQIKLWMLDGDYYIAPRYELDDILGENEADRATYRKERVDCDNFAMFFSGCMGLRRGIASAMVMDFSGKHAYCALPVVEHDGMVNIEVIEPQSDKLVTDLVGKHPSYLAKYGVALWT